MVPLLAFLSLVAVGSLLSLLWIVKRRREHGLFRRHGIPGPPPDLIFGNWEQLREDRLVVMERWIHKYGKVFGFYMAEIPYMVVSDVDLVKQCLVKEAGVFRDRSRLVLTVEPFTSSLLCLRGDDWKQVRSVLNPSFSATKMKLLMHIMNACADVTLEVIDASAQKGETVDMTRVSKGLSMDVITKCALAWQVDCQKDPSDPLLQIIHKIFADADGNVIKTALRFPVLRPVFEWLFTLSEYSKTITKLTDNVRQIIYLRRTGKCPKKMDMLQLLLDAQEGKQSTGYAREDSRPLITEEHLLANSFIFLAGGFEATATSLGFIMYELARNQEEQARVYKELTHVQRDKEDLTYEEIQQMKRLNMVISECLRMYPPIVLFTTRVCTQDTTVMGEFFPAGVNVLVPTWNIHHDPELWPEPLLFNPERFGEDQTKHRHPAAYLPFGIGPRECIGRRFAMLELKIAVCKILAQYHVTPCGETEDPVKLVVPSVVMNPQQGIRLRFKYR
ncbi:unnamed protein product [Ixodes hexagonus]